MRRRGREVLSGLDGGAHLSKGCVTINAFDTSARSGLRRRSRRHRKPDRHAENRGDPRQLRREANLATDQGTLILMPARASRASSMSQPPIRYVGRLSAQNRGNNVLHDRQQTRGTLSDTLEHARLVLLWNLRREVFALCTRSVDPNSDLDFYASQSSCVILREFNRLATFLQPRTTLDPIRVRRLYERPTSPISRRSCRTCH